MPAGRKPCRNAAGAALFAVLRRGRSGAGSTRRAVRHGGPFSDNDGAAAVETLAAMTHVAFPGPKLLVLALATYWQLHSDVQPFHVELVSLTTLQVTTPQLVPLVQGLAGLPAAPRSQA